MLDVIRRGQRWVTGLFVVGIGGVFVFFIGLGGPLQGPSTGSVIQVGDYTFGLRAFERVRGQREQQLRDSAGAEYDSQQFSEPLDQYATQALIERAILAMEGEELGLSIPKQEIEALVKDAFRGEDGRFDQAAFEDRVEYEWGNQRNFILEQRVRLLAGKMLQLIHDGAGVSDGEAREVLRQRLEEVRIAYVVLDGGTAPEGFETTPADVQGLLETREDEIRALYDARSAVYNTPEQVRARHILLSLPRDPSEEQVAEATLEAEETLERLRGGEDFAEIALEVSQDPGSQANGGDLGFFGRGQMVGPLEEAAFTLEPGTLSDPVRTDRGLHILRVEERREAQTRSYESVREEIAREVLGQEAGQAEARALADRLVEATRGDASLEEAARDAGLTLERSGWLRRRPDGFVPKLGAAQDLMATAFGLEPGQSSDTIFEVGDKLALVEVLEHQEAKPEDIEAQLETERQRLEQRKRTGQIQTWIARRRTALLDAGQIAVNLEPFRQ